MSIIHLRSNAYTRDNLCRDGKGTVSRMKKCFIVLLSLILLFLTACSEQEVEVTASHRIYYVNSTDTKLVSEGYEPKGEAAEELLIELLERLKTPAENITYRAPLNESVQFTEYKLEEQEEQLTLYFGEGYSTLTGVSEILTRAAIVKTLCQIPGVEHVAFYVNGQPLMKTAEQPVGWMEATDFIDNTGAETNFVQEAYLTVYYANISGDKLKEAHLKVEYVGNKTQEQLVLEMLIDGPIEAMDDMRATMSENVKINQITTKDGICYVDFSAKFLEKLPSVTEEVAVYSVVNSLVELPNISQVQITVGGETKKVYQSIPLNALLERKLELIEE